MMIYLHANVFQTQDSSVNLFVAAVKRPSYDVNMLPTMCRFSLHSYRRSIITYADACMMKYVSIIGVLYALTTGPIHSGRCFSAQSLSKDLTTCWLSVI